MEVNLRWFIKYLEMTKVVNYIEIELVFAVKPKNGNFTDLTGLKFGRFLVLGIYGIRNHCANWYCKCECGVIKKVVTGALKSGHIKSCGCLKKEVVSKEKLVHGHSGNGKSKTYKTWSGMLSRCRNKKEKSYPDYGGRGITVCKRWLKFEYFLKDVGEIPKGLTIERNDVNGNYEKSNCRLATRKEQNNNKRSNVFLTYENKTQTISQWADELNISMFTLYSRIGKLGWTLDRALTEKTRTHLVSNPKTS